MTVRRSTAVAALSLLLALSGCQKKPAGAGEPSGPVAPEPTVLPTAKVPTVGPNSPPGAIGIATTPDPATCDADKLGPYLNLLPTATAKGEIADKAAPHPVRYVRRNDLGSGAAEPDRVTAVLGADGRIKQFRCG